MNIIFLDIDGVLNSINYFKKIHLMKINYHKNLNKQDELILKLLDIEIEKLYIIKELCFITNSYVVITSSWRILPIYYKIEDYLINFGIPVIDKTKYLSSKRGLEIKTYLQEHKNISNYIIIDDDIFPDFDDILLERLIHTNFYTNGINQDNIDDCVYKLTKD